MTSIETCIIFERHASIPGRQHIGCFFNFRMVPGTLARLYVLSIYFDVFCFGVNMALLLNEVLAAKP